MGSKNGNASQGGGSIRDSGMVQGAVSNKQGQQPAGAGGGFGLATDKKGDPIKSKSGLVTTPGQLKNALDRIDREKALEANMAQLAAIEADPSLSMADYDPSTAGGLNPTQGLSLGQSLGFTGAQLGSELGKMSPASIGAGIMSLALGIPGMGLITGLFGDDDNTSVGPNIADVSNEQQSFLDQVAGMFGPNPSMEPDKGGNKPDPILPILEGAPPTSEDLIGQNPIVPMSEDERLAMLYRLPMGGISNLIS
jgi:hypothetical protein